jgi:hypothetical protein
MFSKKIVKGIQNGNEISYVAPMNLSLEEYLTAKENFEKLGLERNVSKSSDGYGDLGPMPVEHYGSNGMVYKHQPKRAIP